MLVDGGPMKPSGTSGERSTIRDIAASLLSSGDFQRVNNLDITAAATEVPAQGDSYLLLAGMRGLLQKPPGGEDHAGSAVAALEGVCLFEGALHRVVAAQ